MLSRRAFLIGATTIGVGAVAGGTALELAPAHIRYRLGLALSPDHHVPAGNEHVVSGSFASTHVHRSVGWSLALPDATPIGIIYCLHGKGEDHTTAFTELGIPDVVAAAAAPLAVAACDGGGDSYWHPRADGTDAMAMVLDEFIPLMEHQPGLLGRQLGRALLGWSMGGYGALLLAEQRPDLFAAVAAGSVALWTSPGATAPGVFDDAADYHRWDVFASVSRLAGLTVRIDTGTEDPFLAADRAFAALLPSPHMGGFTYGFHDAAYWRSIALGTDRHHRRQAPDLTDASQ